MTNLDDAVSKVGAKRYSMLRRTPSVEKIILLGTALQAASWEAVILDDVLACGSLLPDAM
jgi:hypothetical protein